MNRRRGFSLAELMVALVMAGIIGVALTRLLINQTRFIAAQEGSMKARAGARAGFNAVIQELRMVTAGGLIDATADSLTVRVPYAFGVACRQVSGARTGVSLLPTDSASYAAATPSGYAWRDATGTWTFEEPVVVSAGTVGDCNGASPRIDLVPNGQRIRVNPNNLSTPVGGAIYLYQKVRYALAESADVPGRLALWRTVLSTGTREELVTPFDTSSAFGYLTGNALTYSASAPAVLDSARGIRLRLVGLSEQTPEGRTEPSKFDLSTDIVFMNRAP